MKNDTLYGPPKDVFFEDIEAPKKKKKRRIATDDPLAIEEEEVFD
jgi:hypothetical protein